MNPLEDDPKKGEAGVTRDSRLGETNQGDAVTQADSDSQRSNSSSSLIGTRLGDYQVMRKLGRGGMADVYASRQLSLGRDVALKVLRSDYARDKDYVQRFRREARAAAKLNHPNIVQVFDVGNVDSFHYISQELIDGENLRQSLDKHGVIGLEDAVEILVGVAAALEIAAEAGITHRDIKPENLMLSSRGIIKVADFGLARLGADMDATQSNLTQAGLTLGTPRYMSPEQVQGKTVDVRSDLYSLGVTMYHLLSGRPPFEADDPLALALMHLHETPTPLDRARDRKGASGEADLPEWLIAVVSRLMNKLPQDRFQSPTELLDAVRNEASTSNLGGFGVGTAAATIRLQRATDQARRLRWRKYAQLTAAVLLPTLCAVGAWGYATKMKQRTVTDLLSPDVVTEAETVEEQYLKAMLRDDEAAWRSVSEYFPSEENATNSAYQAKATLQLARHYEDDGRLREADAALDQLMQKASVDRVFQVLALAQRCQLLAKLGRTEKLSDLKRELQTAYNEVKSNNPRGGRLVDQVVSPEVRLMLGIEDS
ncbi:MAG: protein kinase domain-containing protein [Rubripirellula sp.]